MKKQKVDKSDWAIGGMLLVGLGVGFVFLVKSVLYFIASLLIGLGLGLVVAPLLPRKK